MAIGLRLGVVIVMIFFASINFAPANETSETIVPTPRLENVRHWGYQLQKVKPAEIAAADIDVVVIDYSRDGSDESAFSKADVELMKHRPDGGRRTVLAYFSIGEAEDYRFYWQRGWRAAPPSWLAPENPDWPGNYPVRFWYEGWQKIVFAYLQKIIDAGFDGVYLDRVDSFETFSERRTSEREMIEFVAAIANMAREQRPEFFVVPQNAESLLRFSEYRQLISGIGKEDLLFGLRGDGAPNNKEEIYWGRKYLDEAKREGIPVLVIEYLSTPRTANAAEVRLRDMGYVPTFARRSLDRLSTAAR